MARLIDSNDVYSLFDKSGFARLHVSDIDTIPRADAVEVVRCKDCAKDGLFTCPICFIENKTLHFINHSPDFYCGEGERKDGEGNG